MELQKNALYSCIALSRWFILFTKRQEREVNEIVKILQQVSKNLRFEVAAPRL